MSDVSPDRQLVADYVAQGSETAFGALVTRYLPLVYGTALRQVGDCGVAEEIAQNVFMALARKAPRLRGMETLAGWLHRTTILESRARNRADLRRIQREQAAAELANAQGEGASVLEPVEALLDEALLHLRESDRTALMLRFWHDQPLKEVGVALGLEEDAARKRISRALDQLATFFSKRGFQMGAAGCATVLTGASASAVPPTLAAAVTSTALSAGTSSSALTLLCLKLMALTKTQMAAVCVVIAAVPLVTQHRAEARLDDELGALAKQAAAAEQAAAATEQQLATLREQFQSVANEHATAGTQLATLTAQRASEPAARVYQWDDSAPLIRLPKKLLNGLNVTAVADRHGRLTPEISEVLQLTPAEAAQVQATLSRFVVNYNAARAQAMQRVPPTEKELKGRAVDEVRVFELSDIPFKQMRDQLFAELTQVMGSDREQLFRRRLGVWMPIDEEGGLNSGWAVLNGPFRLQLYRPAPDHTQITFGIQRHDSTRGFMSAPFAPDEVPDFCRPHIADWLAVAEANAQKTGK